MSRIIKKTSKGYFLLESHLDGSDVYISSLDLYISFPFFLLSTFTFLMVTYPTWHIIIFYLISNLFFSFIIQLQLFYKVPLKPTLLKHQIKEIFTSTFEGNLDTSALNMCITL